MKNNRTKILLACVCTAFALNANASIWSWFGNSAGDDGNPNTQGNGAYAKASNSPTPPATVKSSVTGSNSSAHKYFQLNNLSTVTITSLEISGVDNHDWEHERPDHNLADKRNIASGEYIREPEDPNPYANGNPFNIKINLANNLPSISIRVNMDADANDLFTKFTKISSPQDPLTVLYYKERGNVYVTVIDNIDTQNWMSKLKDDTLITQVSTPGTHDSATWNVSGVETAFAKTQDFNFNQQLNDGIRFFDIRVRRVEGKSWVLVHGAKYLNLTFTDFMNAIDKFLSTHSQETIFVSIKEDQDPMYKNEDLCKLVKAVKCENFDPLLTNMQVFNSYRKDNTNIKWWVESANIPTLKQVRGKVVLIRRFSLKPEDLEKDNKNPDLGYKSYKGTGIDASDWGDDTIFNNVIGNYQISAQDVYSAGNTDKSNAFLMFIDKPVINNTLAFNFASSSTGSCAFTPVLCANAFYPYIYKELNTKPKVIKGIVPLDFYSQGMVEYIINGNKNIETKLHQ